MAIGIGEEHEELRRTVRRWLEARCPAAVPRATLDAAEEELPAFSGRAGRPGLAGDPRPRGARRPGLRHAQVAVVVEEMARALVPGPVIPTILAAAVLSAGAGDTQGKELLAPVVDGSVAATLALPGSGTLEATPGADGALAVHGTLRPVLGAGVIGRVVAPVTVPAARPAPCGAPSTSTARASRAETLSSLDLTRRVGALHLDNVVVPPEHQLPSLTSGAVRDVALTVAAAECAGGARWCLDTGTAYAKDRRQFGRPIGQFQAVKHRLADMLVAVEQVTALAWDAAQSADADDVVQAGLSAVLAGALALDVYVDCAKACIQVLGGMGFTWEHDAHLHLRRALSLRQLLGERAAARRGISHRLGGRPPASGDRAPRRRRAPARRAAPGDRRGGRRRGLQGAPPPVGRRRARHPALARPVGPRRGGGRTARDRPGDGGGQGAPPAPGGGGVGAAHHHRARHRRAAGALGGPDAARRARVVPVVQ